MNWVTVTTKRHEAYKTYSSEMKMKIKMKIRE